VILISVALLTRISDPVTALPGTATPSPATNAILTSAAPGSAAAVPPTGTLVPPRLDPDATTWPIREEVTVAPGPATATPTGAAGSRVTFTLGEGWRRRGNGWYTLRIDEGITASVAAWAVGRVHVFPCRWAAGELVDPQQTRAAEGLALALSSWWGQDPDMPADSNAPMAPIATRPERGTAGGYPAWYLEILVPSVFDLAACDGGQLILWEASNGEARYALGPGELIRVTVVDVAGEPVVIEGSTFLAGPPEAAAELDRVLGSIVVEPGSG
jgi:hypothetical protein